MPVKNRIFIPNLISSATFEPVRTLPHIYFYNGLKQCEDYFIQHYATNSTSSVVVNQESAFPYVDYYDGLTPSVNSNSLLFFNETPPYGTTPTGSLYTEYWDTYVELLYNPRTRLFKASAIIPLADYFEMELNDIVQWRGNYYHLRAINDYNLKNGVCKIELLGPIIRDAVQSPPFPIPPTPPPPPIEGNKMLILNVLNLTTESIDYANINFNFVDSPNSRSLNPTTGFGTSSIFYYISGSQLPTGSSTQFTLMNITSSFTSPPNSLVFDIDPDQTQTNQIYTITSSFFTDGTLRFGGNLSSPTSRVNTSLSAGFAFNPTTWATLSLDITCSYTESITPNKTFKIQSNNNTGYDFNISGSNKLQLNVGFPSILEKNFIPTGSTELSAARIISGSKGLSAQAFFSGSSFGLMEFTQSMIGNPFNQNLGITKTVVDTRDEVNFLISYGNVNYDLFHTLTGSFTFNSASDEKLLEIQTTNNTSFFDGTGSQNDAFIGRFEPWFFRKDTYPFGLSISNGTRNISGSQNITSAITWETYPYQQFMDVTSSFFSDNVQVSSTLSQSVNINTTTGINNTFGAATNFNNIKTLTAVFELNDFTPPPLTGSRVLQYKVQNNTSESIDNLWWAFDFNDTPNIRLATNSDSTLQSDYLYYISASNVPTGSSVYSTLVNFTASLVSSQEYNLFCDPDNSSALAKYRFDGILRQDGVQQATFTALTASVFDQFPTSSFLNPMTWTTCSFELTASITSSAPPPPTSSICYEIVGVQSAPGECFDCPGFFASSTDIQITFFDECSGSIIPAPFDINVEARYANDTTESTFIPSGSTGSINIAFEDVQCVAPPTCGEIASPQFLSASVVPVTGSINECCI